MSDVTKMLQKLAYITVVGLVSKHIARSGGMNDFLLNNAIIDIFGCVTMALAEEEQDVNPYQFPFAILEAQAFTAYAVRHSDVVETDLHASATRQYLTQEMMPKFNNEISRRMYGLLKAKSFLYRRGLWWFWRKFVRSYHYRNCRSWTFYSPEYLEQGR